MLRFFERRWQSASRRSSSRAFLGLFAMVVAVGVGSRGRAEMPVRPSPDETYTITATLEVVKPFNPVDMQDDFQTVRVVKQDENSCTIEVTYFPLFQPAVGENPHWRTDYTGMTEYLRPTPAENWDEAMQRDLLAELRQAGIDPERLTDKQLVERVSRWAMQRARSTPAFAIWAVYFTEGKPAVFPSLRAAFDRHKSNPTVTDQQMFDEEVLGRAMFYNKVHGSCTSASIYLTTIFRALGIPTRTIFCIPPFDPNDAAQATLFYQGVHHNRIRETVRLALDGMAGFANHLFNEVYVGGRWVRLNYSTLGQPILDAHYFGLLTHIYTSTDLSRVPLAQTWGERYFKYPSGQALLSSVNPYRLLAVRDHFGAKAMLQNPEVPVAELRTVTINGLYRCDDSALPTWLKDGLKSHPHTDEFLLTIKEWVPGSSSQMRAFQNRAARDFLLSAEGRQEIRARVKDGSFTQGDGSFQGFILEVLPADRPLIVPGVEYHVVPRNLDPVYVWQLGSPRLSVTLRRAGAAE